MQFILAPYPLKGDPFKDGKPALGAHISNNSWGCPDLEGCQPDTLMAAAHALHAAGVFVVASAGNDGDRCETVKDPIALYSDVFTVGAVDSSGRLADFSSRGPVTVDGSQRAKPDIVAPGVSILSSYPGNTYARLDSTSMAGPHVAGVVALMWSANPALIGDIESTKTILEETATPYRYDIPICGQEEKGTNNTVGFGIVNAYEAVKKAIKIKK
jgi:subtilisin family serine protease